MIITQGFGVGGTGTVVYDTVYVGGYEIEIDIITNPIVEISVDNYVISVNVDDNTVEVETN